MPSVFSDRATFLPHSLQISIVEKLDRDSRYVAYSNRVGDLLLHTYRTCIVARFS